MLSGLSASAGDGNVARARLAHCTKILTVLPITSVCLLSRVLARIMSLLLHRRLRELLAELRGVTLRAAAYATVLLVILTVATDLYATLVPAPASSSERQAEWSSVARPYPAFALTIPEMIASVPAYAIRRHNFGGGRRHIMTFGAPASGEPYALVEIYRPGAETARFGDVAAAVAALTADLGASRPVAALPLPDTKFGRVDLVDLSIKGPAGPRRCAGFVHSVGEPRMQIVGMYCSSGAELVDRSTLACMIDRLTVISAESDPTLTEYFRRADLRRNFCSDKAGRVAASRQRTDTDWIETGSMPDLRGQLAAR